MAYSNLANDGSLQQFSELWESSRYCQRMSADPDSLRQVLEKTEQLPDLSLCEISHRNIRRDVDDRRGIPRVDLQAEDSIPKDPLCEISHRNIRKDVDDHRGIPRVDLQATDSIPQDSLCEISHRNMSRDVDDRRGIPRVDLQAADSIPEDVPVAKGLKDPSEDEEDKHDDLLPKLGTPSWLSNALLRQQAQDSGSEGNAEISSKWCSSCGVDGSGCMCSKNMQTSPPPRNRPYTDWLSAVPIVATHPRDSSVGLPGAQRKAAEASGRYTLNAENSGEREREHQRVFLGLHMDSGTEKDEQARHSSNPGADCAQERDENVERGKDWEEARMKAKILAHPMFAQMLAAHVGCLRIATPVDQLKRIDDQLSQSQHVIDKYSAVAPEGEDLADKEELDSFMRNYTMVLINLQEQLQNHVRVHATEAMVGCWELEQQLYNLTGVTPGPGTGATMSDDEDDQAADSDGAGYETGLDAQDCTGGYGPLVPTETERSIMERVRQELKNELTEGYRDKISDVREEILRKRRAGKLPEGTTTVLKTWWNSHSKWPYPTEDEKERLIQDTGLELKQVNNWFINQRKRNWHSNTLPSSSEIKNKRKAPDLTSRGDIKPAEFVRAKTSGVKS